MMKQQVKKLGICFCIIILLTSACVQKHDEEKRGELQMNTYQLRYATIDIPEGVTVIPDLSYEVNDDDKEIAMNVRIKEYDNDDIRPYFDKEIAKLQYSNKIVDIVKQTSEDISGNKAAILRIEYKTDINFEMEFVEYVGILCEKRYIVFKAWGFLKLFTPGEHLWQALYRSFRSDKSQPYKLPFGSFILPEEGVDYSHILPYFPDEDDYKVEISYISDDRAQEIIREFKPNILGIFLKAYVRILQNKILVVDKREGRYFEAQTTVNAETIPTAFFHIADGDKTVLQIEIIAEAVDIFNRYRPQMEAMIQSIVFENDGFDVKTH